MEDERGRNLLDRHALEVSKPLVEALHDEAQLGQMEMRFRLVGVDPEDSLQQALGAIPLVRAPLQFRLEQQLVALRCLELPCSPQPKPLCALFSFASRRR